MIKGRKLDLLAAEKVLRWDKAYAEFCVGGFHPWSPSSRIDLAWQIVDKLAPDLRLELIPTSEGYQATFLKYTPENEYSCWTSGPLAEAPTAQLAICLAGLAAVKGK